MKPIRQFLGPVLLIVVLAIVFFCSMPVRSPMRRAKKQAIQNRSLLFPVELRSAASM